MTTLTATAIVLLVACVGVWGQDDITEINSRLLGKMRGKLRKSADGTAVKEFLGIPYAKPPVRFQQPKSPDKFKEPFEAFKMGPACMQYSETPYPWYDSEPGQSEDCLYLNVWSPAESTLENQRPVKIYIHGGGWFQTGSNRLGYYDGFGEALDTKDENGNSLQDGVVVVTVNFRLGAFGFLTSGTRDAPGNMGLFDISQAHNWLQKNLQYLGGNYKNMTFVGEGSGGIATSLFPTAITEFSVPSTKYICNGGSAHTLKALEGVGPDGDPYNNNLRLTDVLAQALGCETSIKDKPKETVECLRGVNATNLVKTMASIAAKGPPNVFLPQLKGPDGFFLFDPFMAFYKSGFSSRSDVLATVTSEAGSNLITTAFPEVFGKFGENDVALSAACAKQVTRKLLKKFPQNVTDALLGNLTRKASESNRQRVIRAIGDVYFNCPAVFFGEDQKRPKDNKVSQTKFYLLEKQVYPPYNPWADWMGSVGFSNAQIEFVHPDGKLTVNNQTYDYTDEQSEQARVNRKLFLDNANSRPLPFPEYTTEVPAYGILNKDGTFLIEKKNYHKRNCDILRPYFEYKQSG